MTTRRHAPHQSRWLAAAALLAAFILLPTPAVSVATQPLVPSIPGGASGGLWQWPLTGPVSVARPYEEPDHEYGDGHRGIDLWAGNDGGAVVAPAGGTIAWAGTVADRPLVTIDHGNGFVTTLEPVVAALHAGSRVEAGAIVGHVSSGGHAAAGSLHWGVRRDGAYVNPATLFSRISRPILLPCCAE